MRTSKPISTICYNTKEFLINVLNELQYLRYISFWEFIIHLPDTDDKKQHVHLYIEPSKVIDTDELMPKFTEQDPLNPDKPFVLHHIQSSKFGDWYWYALHDKDYLKAKMLTRNKFYSDSDIICSDIITHNYKVAENPLINYANMSDLAIREQIFYAVNNGISLPEFLHIYKIPLGKIASVSSFYHALSCYYSPIFDEHGKFKGNKQIDVSSHSVSHTCQQIAIGQAVATDDDPIF